jgi:hypothetical protein
MNDKITFGDYWKNMLWAHLAPLEEGVFKQWHGGRIVLVGDAVHKVSNTHLCTWREKANSCFKMTPNQAYSANSAMESVAALCNGLNRALQASPNSTLSRDQISTVFQGYYNTRKSRATRAKDLSGFLTRLCGWDGALQKSVTKWIKPLVLHGVVADRFADLVRGGVKLDYVQHKEGKTGSVPWDDQVKGKSNSCGAGQRSCAICRYWGMDAMAAFQILTTRRPHFWSKKQRMKLRGGYARSLRSNGSNPAETTLAVLEVTEATT